MNKIRLFIENKEVELNDNVQFAITKQFSDLENPTTIINDWSKTVEIPFSQNNNKLFGELYKTDRLIAKNKNYINNSNNRFSFSNPKMYNVESNAITFDFRDAPYFTINSVSIFTADVHDLSVDTLYNNITTPGHFHKTFYGHSVIDGIKISLNGTPYIPTVILSLDEVSANKQYSISFDIYGTPSSKIIRVYNICVTEGTNDIKFEQLKYSTGIYFDPYKMLDFKLFNEDDLIMSGYAKTNSVSFDNNYGFYNITLNGEIGKIFKELQKITPILSNTSDIKYYIGDVLGDNVINRDLVYKSWNNTPRLDIPISNADTTDIIGFAPTNRGTIEGFDNNSIITPGWKKINIEDFPVVTSDDTTKTIKEAYDKQGFDITTLLKNGLSQAQMSQFRSYLCTPYIFVKRLFEILGNKCYELTGYNIEIDKDWTYKNPYFNNMVMMLNDFNTSDTVGYYGQGNLPNTNVNTNKYTLNQYTKIRFANTSEPEGANIIELLKDQGSIYTGYPVRFNIPNKTNLSIACNLPLRLNMELQQTLSSDAILNLNKNTYFSIEIRFTGENGRTSSFYVYIAPTDTNYNFTDDSIKVIYLNSLTIREFLAQGAAWNIELPIYKLVNNTTFGNYVDVEIMPVLRGDGTKPLRDVNSDQTFAPKYDPVFYQNPIREDIKIYNVISLSNRSFSYFSFENIWDANYSFFECLLNYSKMFRLIWNVDMNKKLIKIQQFSTYIDEIKNNITDITDRVDISSNITIDPLYIKSKKLLFNYSNKESDLNKNYKDINGLNYGEKSIISNYVFNEDTKKLFSNASIAIDQQINDISWSDIKKYAIKESAPGIQSTVRGIYDGNLYINATNNGKSISNFGAFLIWGGNIQNTNNTDLYITDDSVTEIADSQYCYTDILLFNNSILTNKLPLLGNAYDIGYEINGEIEHRAVMSTFSIPARIFYNLPQNRQVYKDLYEVIWKKYVEDELLNVNTKVINCKIKISPSDFSKYTYNKFVLFNGTLCIINKISNYDVNSVYTECELITVNNLDNYKIDFTKWIRNNEGLAYYIDDDKSVQNKTYRFYYEDSDKHPDIKIANNKGLSTITLNRVGNTNYWDVYIPSYSSEILVEIYYTTQSGSTIVQHIIDESTFLY